MGLGQYSADFSPEAGFYLLSYEGPKIPWQRVVKTNDKGPSVPVPAHLLGIPKRACVPIDFNFVVNNNDRLNATWSRFETPIIQHTTIDSDGYGAVFPPIPPPSYQPMSDH